MDEDSMVSPCDPSYCCALLSHKSRTHVEQHALAVASQPAATLRSHLVLFPRFE
jgi:hypothetical protein